jgi:hypothetical protein
MVGRTAGENWLLLVANCDRLTGSEGNEWVQVRLLLQVGFMTQARVTRA